MKFFKIVLSGVLSFYLIFGLVAGVLLGSQLKASAIVSNPPKVEKKTTEPASRDKLGPPAPTGATPKPGDKPSTTGTATPPATTGTAGTTSTAPATTDASTAGISSAPSATPLGVDLQDALGFKACNVSGRTASQSPDALQVCVRAILQFVLTLAGIIAIIQLGIAALNYFNPDVSSDVVKDSIETVRNIFIGLMLIAAPVVILRTFNVSLTNFGFLGFTASEGGSSSGGSTGSTGSTSAAGTANTSVVGGVALSPTDTAANLNNVTKAIEKLKAGEISKDDLAKAIDYTLANIDLKNVDVATVIKMLDTAQAAGVTINLPADLAAKFNSSGPKADGIQTANQASYCNLDPCEISSARVLPLTATSQSLRVTLKNKNNNPTDYLLILRPLNTIPKPISDFVSLTPSALGANPTVNINKKSITGAEFARWCSAAGTEGGNGGAACQKSPASSGGVIYGPVDIR